MATVKLYLDARTAKADGTHPVKLAVYHKGDIMIGTGISVRTEQWTGIADAPTDNKQLNRLLVQMLAQAKSVIYTLRADGKLSDMDKATLANILRNAKAGRVDDEPKNEKSPLLATYYHKFVEAKVKQGTRAVYENTRVVISRHVGTRV